MREAQENYVSGHPLHLALREMRTHFSDGRVLASITVVALLLGIAGPFGTFELLETGPRLVYWAAIALSTYGLGFAVGVVLEQVFGLTVRNRWVRVVLFGAVTGVPVTLAVMAVNFVALGTTGLPPFGLWLQCTLIGMGVIAIGEIHGHSARSNPVSAPQPPQAPPILDRVPPAARGALWALVVQDHYVEIVTERGRTLVLMRLSDAIREVGETRGVQIHRSHWVALPAIANVVRIDGKPQVELPDGRRLGISRGYLAAAREAGVAA